MIVAELVMLAFGDHTAVHTFGMDTGFWPFLGSWLAIDVLIPGWLLLWWWQAERARFGLKYLNPIAFRALIALAEGLVDGEREALPPLDVARTWTTTCLGWRPARSRRCSSRSRCSRCCRCGCR